MDATTIRTNLRQRLTKDEVLLVPGSQDVLSVRLFEKMGFEAVWAGGFMSAASRLGLPDANLITLSEHAEFARHCAFSVDVPVIVDVDNGFGNAINVIRTVREFERAGVAAIVLEDQVVPKRCGLFPGKRPIIEADEMVGKIRAATDAREDDAFMIIARTDSFGAGLSIDDAVERAKTYVDAGADAVLPISKQWENLAGFAKTARNEGLRCPLITAPTLFGDVTYQQVGELGFNAQIQPLAAPAAALWAMREVLETWKRDGAPGAYLDRSFTFEEITDLIGIPEIAEAENAYLPQGSSLTED